MCRYVLYLGPPIWVSSLITESATYPTVFRKRYAKILLGDSLCPLGSYLERELGPGSPQIWIKRDDLTGLAFGGNKARKLEYLVAAALANGALAHALGDFLQAHGRFSSESDVDLPPGGACNRPGDGGRYLPLT